MANKRSNEESDEIQVIFVKRQKGDGDGLLASNNEDLVLPSDTSQMRPFNLNIENPTSSYHISGKLAQSDQKFVQGKVEERGSDLEEIGLEVVGAASALPITGEVTIQSCEDGPAGSKLDMNLFDDQYAHKLFLQDHVICYTSGVAFENMKLEGAGFTCRATVAGYRKALDKLSVRLGAGGVSFWVTSGGKLWKIRVVPTGKDTNCLTWKRDGQFLNLCCK